MIKTVLFQSAFFRFGDADRHRQTGRQTEKKNKREGESNHAFLHHHHQQQQLQQKSDTELTASVLKKDLKHTRD